MKRTLHAHIQPTDQPDPSFLPLPTKYVFFFLTLTATSLGPTILQAGGNKKNRGFLLISKSLFQQSFQGLSKQHTNLPSCLSLWTVDVNNCCLKLKVLHIHHVHKISSNFGCPSIQNSKQNVLGPKSDQLPLKFLKLHFSVKCSPFHVTLHTPPPDPATAQSLLHYNNHIGLYKSHTKQVHVV